MSGYIAKSQHRAMLNIERGHKDKMRERCDTLSFELQVATDEIARLKELVKDQSLVLCESLTDADEPEPGCECGCCWAKALLGGAD